MAITDPNSSSSCSHCHPCPAFSTPDFPFWRIYWDNPLCDGPLPVSKRKPDAAAASHLILNVLPADLSHTSVRRRKVIIIGFSALGVLLVLVFLFVSSYGPQPPEVRLLTLKPSKGYDPDVVHTQYDSLFAA